jgi:serine phosphatase RsbU (regulator of sigma subunit)
MFATVCMVRISPDRRGLLVWSAGHPPPLLLDDNGQRELPTEPHRLPLGIDPACVWSPAQLSLRPRWQLMLYTDGLIEGRSGGEQYLWVEDLLNLVRAQQATDADDPQQLVNGLVKSVRLLGPENSDDVAVVLLTDSPRPPDRADG